MEVKNTCPVGWGSFSARGIEKNRIWRCFSTAGIFTTGHSGIFRPGGNYWCGTTNNTPSSLMYQRWWKQGLQRVRRAYGTWIIFKHFSGEKSLKITSRRRVIYRPFECSPNIPSSEPTARKCGLLLLFN